MKRSLYRLVVFAAAAFVLFGPVAEEPIQAQEECSFVNLYCNNNDWCDHWWQILIGYPYTFYEIEFCCTWNGNTLDCWYRHVPLSNGACCTLGMFDSEEDPGEGGDDPAAE